MTKVMVGMSGGVDSSVCAVLLQRAGFDVCGATLRLCDTAFDVAAPAVADALGIVYTVLDRRDAFTSRVVERFVNGYAEGMTPNPCIDCNRFIKFPLLLQAARQQGATHIATGHYARIIFDEGLGRWTLMRGKDPDKDQSYVLYSLTQDILAHTLMPLGHYDKATVRSIAHEDNIPSADRPESQDICFIPDGDHVGFIERVLPRAACPGDIVDVRGQVLGHHQGLCHYTIGQRKGIGLPVCGSHSQPYFVCGKDAATNCLLVGMRDELSVRGCRLIDVNWVSIAATDEELRVQVKTRYRQQAVRATLSATKGGTGATVVFDEPIEAVAPGQACVFYDGDMALGGGTISTTFN